MTQIKAPRGAPDIYPPDSELLSEIEAHARTLFDRYGYRRIETPIFEDTELFQRGVGESSDIVRKEMYTFTDRKGRSLTLRPEGTASVARAVIEHKLYATLPLRLSYFGPMFRYERPQKGRNRQFFQVGIECFGSRSPVVDAEVITWGAEFYTGVGLAPDLLLNSLGCDADREKYRAFLRERLEPRLDELCGDCHERLHVNPLRVFDCKVESCRAIVGELDPMSKFLCSDCADHLAQVKRLLEASEVAWQDADHLVRGLDYYTGTIFEFDLPSVGARSALGGGGRYDNLVEQLGGPSVPAVGLSPGLEPVMVALREMRAVEGWRPDAYVAWLDSSAAATGVRIAKQLRMAGLRVTTTDETKSLKSQLGAADKLGAARTIILGPDEISRGVAAVRDMATKAQEEIVLDELPRRLST